MHSHKHSAEAIAKCYLQRVVGCLRMRAQAPLQQPPAARGYVKRLHQRCKVLSCPNLAPWDGTAQWLWVCLYPLACLSRRLYRRLCRPLYRPLYPAARACL